MTKEELRKEATSTIEWESTPMIDRPTFINGYIVGAEPREKRIEELEQENAELKKSIKYVNTICERKSVTNSQLTELAADSSAKLYEAKGIIKELLDFDFLPENEIKKQAEQF